MIVNELKPCCEECGDIDLSCETEKFEYLVGENKAMSKIYCEHQAVCKKYLENGTSTHANAV